LYYLLISKVKETEDKILFGAFKLFLTKNFERVTIADLEKALGLSRGAIFYYMKTKEELFRRVVDKYVLSPHSVDNKFASLKDNSLIGFIQFYIDSINKTMKSIESCGVENLHRSYFSLIFQAIQYYPDFSRLISEVFEKELELWKRVVNNAHDSGEIRKEFNVEIVAMHFRYIYSGLSFEMSLKKGLDTILLQSLFMEYYNKIKA